MNVSEQRFLAILDYWHKVEFFIPFDLKQILDTPDAWTVKWVRAEDLRAPASTALWQVRVPEDRVLSGFKLFLGVFETSAIAEFAQCLPTGEEGNEFEEAERTELEGRSCIARIQLDVHGQPIFDRVAVSTAPWALGHAKENGLSALGADAFAADRRRLEDLLYDFQGARIGERGERGDEKAPLPLNHGELAALQRLFINWAGYEPHAGLPVALVQILTQPANKKRREAVNGLVVTVAAAPDTTGDEDEEDEDGGDDAPTIDILNSFYIDDIERCMVSVRNGNVPSTMQAYLTPLDESQRVDLYTARGGEAIIEALHPSRFNAGHWLEDSSRKMSLMQQFAINTALGSLKKEGLFSVNGPPGTGKTTLLRELICENIVQRSRFLATLTHPADALDSKATTVHFADGAATIRAIRPELTGFEMVVASSNNAAVENISNDLPKRKQLGHAWRETKYLQPVAHKVAAQNEDGGFTKLEPDDVPWGLISCALGNATNARRFAGRFAFGDLPETSRSDPNAPCHIRDWIARYSGMSFDAAKRVFNDADASVRAALDEREEYAALHEELLGVSQAEFTLEAMAAVDVAQTRKLGAERSVALARDDLNSHEARIGELREEERLIDRTAPSFFGRLFQTAAARRHAADVSRNVQEQRRVRSGLAQYQERVQSSTEELRVAKGALDSAHAGLNERHAVWTQKRKDLMALHQRFAGITLPSSVDALDSDAFQVRGMWQDGELSHLRSTLFAAALALHEAWLAEAARKGGAGFGGNLVAINKLLNGSWPDDPKHVPLIWQSVFMIVPVVSSTFASFARQFRHMGTRSIGWLFIDEAGQAVPQAAVGALWRAQRAVVVGDPLQIEPVFTVPTRLINALGAQSAHTANGSYSPAYTSVQRLADDANQYGTLVATTSDKSLWIGSPLRVHRRCADPMFTIANRIAYHGKMVFGLESREPAHDSLNLGKSAWVDVPGKASFKQVVPTQVDLLVELILKLYARDGLLPALYIISPFKAIKTEILSRFHAVKWPSRSGVRGISTKAWRKWCKERIGTVHTFQGKEEKVVIFVLGTDHDGRGAAAWAASKPNLLNVALTRAQQRFYVIGDATLWGGLPHFDLVLSRLETISAQSWLTRCDVAGD